MKLSLSGNAHFFSYKMRHQALQSCNSNFILPFILSIISTNICLNPKLWLIGGIDTFQEIVVAFKVLMQIHKFVGSIFFRFTEPVSCTTGTELWTELWFYTIMCTRRRYHLTNHAWSCVTQIWKNPNPGKLLAFANLAQFERMLNELAALFNRQIAND